MRPRVGHLYRERFTSFTILQRAPPTNPCTSRYSLTCKGRQRVIVAFYLRQYDRKHEFAGILPYGETRQPCRSLWYHARANAACHAIAPPGSLPARRLLILTGTGPWPLPILATRRRCHSRPGCPSGGAGGQLPCPLGTSPALKAWPPYVGGPHRTDRPRSAPLIAMALAGLSLSKSLTRRVKQLNVPKGGTQIATWHNSLWLVDAGFKPVCGQSGSEACPQSTGPIR